MEVADMAGSNKIHACKYAVITHLGMRVFLLHVSMSACCWPDVVLLSLLRSHFASKRMLSSTVDQATVVERSRIRACPT